MTHPHPWRIDCEDTRPPGYEVEIVDADDGHICWAYQQEASAIVAASEAARAQLREKQRIAELEDERDVFKRTLDKRDRRVEYLEKESARNALVAQNRYERIEELEAFIRNCKRLADDTMCGLSSAAFSRWAANILEGNKNGP